MTKILVLHGPNLNLLGQREPEVYGRLTLEEINSRLKESGEKLGLEVVSYQSNGEGALIDALMTDSANANDAIVQTVDGSLQEQMPRGVPSTVPSIAGYDIRGILGSGLNRET